MMDSKHKFFYGPEDRAEFTKDEAEKEVQEIVDYIKKQPFDKHEKSMHLYYNDNYWHIIADSADAYKKGLHIKEFLIQ